MPSVLALRRAAPRLRRRSGCHTPPAGAHTPPRQPLMLRFLRVRHIVVVVIEHAFTLFRQPRALTNAHISSAATYHDSAMPRRALCLSTRCLPPQARASPLSRRRHALPRHVCLSGTVALRRADMQIRNIATPICYYVHAHRSLLLEITRL